MNIDVNTDVGPDKSVTCDLSVDGQHVAVTFANGEIILGFESAVGPVTFTVPQNLVAEEVSQG